MVVDALGPLEEVNEAVEGGELVPQNPLLLPVLGPVRE